MNTKLTLRMDDKLISSAKEYSAKTGKSLYPVDFLSETQFFLEFNICVIHAVAGRVVNRSQ